MVTGRYNPRLLAVPMGTHPHCHYGSSTTISLLQPAGAAAAAAAGTPATAGAVRHPHSRAQRGAAEDGDGVATTSSLCCSSTSG